jgi:hypothetical protein
MLVSKLEGRCWKLGERPAFSFFVGHKMEKDLVLVPKAGIRIVQRSAGARSSGGNEISSNRRLQQQKKADCGGRREESKK